ncbi:MAG: hypothetical protein V3T31_06610, partial [candidate division Zixibacteria bacterium]
RYNCSQARRVILTRLACIVLTVAPLLMLSPVLAVPNSSDSLAVDLTVYDSLIIDSIEIDNREIFDTDQPRYNNFAFKTANRLHIITRAKVIRRELLFEVGGKFSADLAEETARNLRFEYAIFNAWVEVEELENGHLLVRLVTVDQWSLAGGLVVKREGEETDFRIGFEERNFLGRNQIISVEYSAPEREDNYFKFGFTDRRLAGRPFRVRSVFDDNPRNRVRLLSFGKPFYNLSQHLAYNIQVVDRAMRNDLYDDGDLLVARSRSKSDEVLSELTYRWGSYKRKTGLRFLHDYQSESVVGTEILESDPDSIVFGDDSLYHYLAIGGFVQDFDYVTISRINGFDVLEDFQLGQQFSVAIGRAFKPDFHDHIYDHLSMNVRYAARLGSHLILMDYLRKFWYRADESLRRTSDFTLRLYNDHFRFLTGAMRVKYRRDWRDDRSARILLGGATGLRGYSRQFRRGERVGVINLEARFFPGLELASVMFGSVLFVDIGRAWKAGEPFDFNEFNTSFGCGLRVSLEKAAEGQILRIDIARNDLNGWQLSFGTGQYF